MFTFMQNLRNDSYILINRKMMFGPEDRAATDRRRPFKTTCVSFFRRNNFFLAKRENIYYTENGLSMIIKADLK